MFKLSLLLLLFCMAAHAETAPKSATSHARKVLIASLAVVTSAAVADTATSWNRNELNPLLGRSRFGAGQASIKFSMLSAAAVFELFWARRHGRSAALFTGINFASAGVIGATAYRNSTIGRH